jgi:cytochrome c-type biogenesis protein CcmF
MTRILGLSAVWIALLLSIYGMVAAVVGVRWRRRDLVRSAEAAVYVNFGLLTLANLAMVYALVTRDFSVGYVAQVGSHATPLFYTIISLWGALEGSILFWGWVLALYTAAAVWLNRNADLGSLLPYATATMLAVGAFFYLLLVGPSNPFHLVWPAPADGPGPNPLLQNHWLMGVHPPLLYLGYVGMTVPFAFAIGALLSGKTDSTWLRLTRRWTITAWAFLSAAIMAGMWWSYEVLGWGGYWAWDPVENASFLPWLTATAFLHSAMVQERRGMLRLWNVSLIIATFALTILGTFLTRSGVISSVHAFTQGTIGYYFLAFIAVVVVFSLAVLAGRSEQLASEGNLDSAASRETVFMVNNLVFVVFTFTVLLGTLFPLLAEAVRGVKVSVGAPFFNRMTVPLMATLIFLMGVGPALPWRRASREVLWRQFGPPFAALFLTAAVALVLGARHVWAILTFAFVAFALTSNVREYIDGVRGRMRAQGEKPLPALGRLIAANPRRYGGYIAHFGIMMMAVGIAASSIYQTDVEATLRRGESIRIGEFDVRFDELWATEEPQRFVVGASLSVFRNGRPLGMMDPRLNFYPMSEQPITTPSVRSRPHRDLYANLMAFDNDGSTATLHLIIEPFVMWIWIGGTVIALGAFIAIWPFRRGGAASLLELEREAVARRERMRRRPADVAAREAAKGGVA